MQLSDLIRSTHTCRYYKPDPLPPALIARVVDAARWAPSGGNRQPLSVVVVRDHAKKIALRDLYLPVWNTYVEGLRAGSVRLGAQSLALNSPNQSERSGARSSVIDSANHFAQHMAEIPVLLLVCARLADVHPTDNQLGRLSIVGGASVYPAVQNMLLTARNEGLGSALTTLHCALEPQIKSLFNIPEAVSLAAVVMLGWPVQPFPSKLTRRPLGEMMFDGEFDKSFAAADLP